MDDNFKKEEQKLLNKCQAIDELYEAYAKKFNLTYMSLTVLECIYENISDCSQKTIIEQTHYPKQSVNLIVKSFLEEGYLKLIEDSNDRRNKKIRVTKKGKTYFDKVILPLWKIDEIATTSLERKDREIFLKCIDLYEKAFRDQIEKITKK